MMKLVHIFLISFFFSSVPSPSILLQSIYGIQLVNAFSISSIRPTTTITTTTVSQQQQQRFQFQLKATPTESTSTESTEECDILVLGSGPAGLAISSLLAQHNNNNNDRAPFRVILADANYDREFAPNYGVWRDEWDAVLERYETQHKITIGTNPNTPGSIDREWSKTDCFFGGSFDIPTQQRMRLDRPYCRVDKQDLRQSFLHPRVKVLQQNHISNAVAPNLYAPAGSLLHDQHGSTITLQSKDGTSKTVLRTKLIIDTTGHETQLVLRDTRAPADNPPGFQIAYGCLVRVNETDNNNNNNSPAPSFGPYDKKAMTLFDYRTDHFDGDDVAQQKAIKDPTFMYAMPLDGNQVFFEETSLVARPAISFQECKDRCFTRLKYLGIDVTDIIEEEFCYIPMGGSLPIKDQRIIGLGGASAMVHPSTGYHLCRMLMGASDMANAIISELDKENKDDINLDRAAASAYHAIWTPENIRQRNFAVFGGEFLMEQDVVGLRGFFDGFFRLPLELWAGFLAGWPGLPNNDKHETWLARMWFGLNFVIRIPAPVALSMVGSILMYSLKEGAPLPQSVTPFLGQPPSYKYKDALQANVGDVAVKDEARRMIIEARLTEEVPVAFGDDDDDDDDAGEEKISLARDDVLTEQEKEEEISLDHDDALTEQEKEEEVPLDITSISGNDEKSTTFDDNFAEEQEEEDKKEVPSFESTGVAGKTKDAPEDESVFQ